MKTGRELYLYRRAQAIAKAGGKEEYNRRLADDARLRRKRQREENVEARTWSRSGLEVNVQDLGAAPPERFAGLVNEILRGARILVL